VIAALLLVLAGTILSLAYQYALHIRTDHVQHHALILVINELIRRDPSLQQVLVPIMSAEPAPEAVPQPQPNPQ